MFFEVLCVLRIPRESISFSGLQGFRSHLMVDLVNAYPLMVYLFTSGFLYSKVRNWIFPAGVQLQYHR